ncbi:MAG: hypothetical protein OEV52_05820 [Dehalococcoidia bacterium]|nr:hypothetical protein [Dehalococcoidia bacterium]
MAFDFVGEGMGVKHNSAQNFMTAVSGLRHGVTTRLVGEVMLYEILGAKIVRIQDEQSGFELLEPGVN